MKHRFFNSLAANAQSLEGNLSILQNRKMRVDTRPKLKSEKTPPCPETSNKNAKNYITG
jgi:hypothetical protein